MSKKVLLINDLPGYGKVALAAMMPILTHLGLNTFNLPTALVSNTLDYGKFDILETTEYMKNTLRVWDELEFSFDAISTGFIVSQEQVDIISAYCQKKAKTGTQIFCDPIMGDEGKLYNSITDETIRSMRNLCSVADYIVPNYTEACYLADIPYKESALTDKDVEKLVTKLLALGTKSVVITSAKVLEDNKEISAVIVYDGQSQKISCLPFKLIPVRFPGTGDTFSAIMLGKILQGYSLIDSVNSAMNIVYALINNNLHSQDTYKGIPLESCLNLLDEKN